jgi:hypothetical protein
MKPYKYTLWLRGVSSWVVDSEYGHVQLETHRPTRDVPNEVDASLDEAANPPAEDVGVATVLLLPDMSSPSGLPLSMSSHRRFPRRAGSGEQQVRVVADGVIAEPDMRRVVGLWGEARSGSERRYITAATAAALEATSARCSRNRGTRSRCGMKWAFLSARPGKWVVSARVEWVYPAMAILSCQQRHATVTTARDSRWGGAGGGGGWRCATRGKRWDGEKVYTNMLLTMPASPVVSRPALRVPTALLL